MRAKGFLWLASRNDTAGLLSQAGPSLTFQAAGKWIATYPEEEQRQILNEAPELLERLECSLWRQDDGACDDWHSNESTGNRK